MPTLLQTLVQTTVDNVTQVRTRYAISTCSHDAFGLGAELGAEFVINALAIFQLLFLVSMRLLCCLLFLVAFLPAYLCLCNEKATYVVLLGL